MYDFSQFPDPSLPLNPDQSENINRIREACKQLNEERKGFHYPDGRYDNLSSMIGNANFVLGHYLYLFDVDTDVARMLMAASMNVGPLSDADYDQMIQHCHLIFENQIEGCLETFDALTEMDRKEMRTLADVSSYVPLVCIYTDIMEASAYSALALTGDESRYESRVMSEMEGYVNKLLSRAFKRIPNLTSTKPFEAVYDA